KGNIQEETGKDGRYWGRAFRVRIWEPVVERRQSDLGSVSNEQEDECESDDSRFQIGLSCVQVSPEQCCHALASERALCGKIEKDRTEECLCDPHTTQNEIFPGRFQTRLGSVERNQQHG